MGNLNAWEIIVLVLLALFLLGPERLPKLVGDAVRLLRRLRAMARDATDGLSRELGTQVTLEDLHPKTFIRTQLMGDDDDDKSDRPKVTQTITADVSTDVTTPTDVTTDVSTPTDVTTPPTSASFQNASRRDAPPPQRVRSATNASAVNIAPCTAYVRSQVVRMCSISGAPCCVPDAADRRLPPASACASRATE